MRASVVCLAVLMFVPMTAAASPPSPVQPGMGLLDSATGVKALPASPEWVFIAEEAFIQALAAAPAYSHTRNFHREAGIAGGLANDPVVTGVVAEYLPGMQPFSGELFVVVRDAKLDGAFVQATDYYVVVVELSGTADWVGRVPVVSFGGAIAPPSMLNCCIDDYGCVIFDYPVGVPVPSGCYESPRGIQCPWEGALMNNDETYDDTLGELGEQPPKDVKVMPDKPPGGNPPGTDPLGPHWSLRCRECWAVNPGESCFDLPHEPDENPFFHCPTGSSGGAGVPDLCKVIRGPEGDGDLYGWWEFMPPECGGACLTCGDDLQVIQPDDHEAPAYCKAAYPNPISDVGGACDPANEALRQATLRMKVEMLGCSGNQQFTAYANSLNNPFCCGSDCACQRVGKGMVTCVQCGPESCTEQVEFTLVDPHTMEEGCEDWDACDDPNNQNCWGSVCTGVVEPQEEATSSTAGTSSSAPVMPAFSQPPVVEPPSHFAPTVHAQEKPKNEDRSNGRNGEGHNGRGMTDRPSPYGVTAKRDQTVGDPIDPGSGAFLLQHTDFSFNAGATRLEFVRHYESRNDERSFLGSNWTHNWDVSIQALRPGTTPYWASAYCEGWRGFPTCLLLSDGPTSRLYVYDGAQKVYLPQAGDFSTVVLNAAGGWSLRRPDGSSMHFNEYGSLERAVDRFGNGFQVDNENTPALSLFEAVCSGATMLEARCRYLTYMIGEGPLPQIGTCQPI